MAEEFAVKPQNNEPWDVVIIGSGPAAFTAAIYTTRGAASTLLFTGDAWGGQLMLTTEVDNFPGFPEGIQGPDLMDRMKKQAERFGAELVMEDAENVELTGEFFTVSSRSKTVNARSVILATGALTKWLGVPGEDTLRGRGVSSCAPCDAPFFKGKKVFVVGGGDSAMEEALVLSKYASEVTIVHRRDTFKASAAMQSRIKNTPTIKTLMNSEIVEMVGTERLEKVKVKTLKEGKEEVTEILIDGVFVAIGHIPSTAIFHGKIDLDEKGYIKRIPNEKYTMATSREGVFVAGDVHDTHYKQAITAAGFGCMAALEVLSHLDKAIPTW